MRRIKITAGIFLLIFTAVAMVGTADYIKAQERQQEIAGKVLRFHVRANSDAGEDQNLKLKVRDAVGVLLSEKLRDVTDLEACKRVVNDNMRGIVCAAERVIEQEGYDYPVEAYLAKVDFPDKTYGMYTFPAGRYEALELVIGSGTGHNWWCVMYPNMCFAGSGYEEIEDGAKDSLERALEPEEYRSLMENKNYKIRFKFLTFLNKYFE